MAKWDYVWENAPYDTQQWNYLHIGDTLRVRCGYVSRVLVEGGLFSDKLFRYKAMSYATKSSMFFDTRNEAMAWIVACERMY